MKSSFQTILLVIFGVVFAAAVFIFSGLINIGSGSKSSTTPQGTVVIWGILPDSAIAPYLDNFNISSNDYSIRYEYHAPSSLAQDLTVALSNNAQPDLVIYSSELLSSIKNRLYMIPYAAYSERTYRDTNIDGAQIFLTKDGIAGMPLVVDPLVVYYNKDILAKDNFVIPSSTWSGMQRTIPILTKRDARNTILQSTIGLGTAQNIDHLKDILAALFLQTGNSIVTSDPQTGRPQVVVANTTPGTTESPAAQALAFYTSFGDPTNSNYTWNNALPSTKTQFIASKSAFYIGRASELFAIQSQNPNLNFDVAPLFQTDVNARPMTFGSFIAVDMLKNAPNPVAAYAAVTFLSSQTSVDALSKSLALPPVRRDLLLVQQSNPYVAIFFKTALSAFGWLDPDPIATDTIFQNLVTAVTSGKNDTGTALSNAGRDLQSIVQ